MHFWSADFLLFAVNRVLAGQRDRGRQGKLSEVAFCAGKVLVVVLLWLPAVGSQGVNTSVFTNTALGSGTLFAFREGGEHARVPRVPSFGRAPA